MICHFSLVLLSLKLLLCNCFTSLIPEISLGVSSLEHLCSSSIVDHPNALFLLSIAKEQGGAIPFSIAQFMSGNDFARGLVSGAISRVSKEVLLHPFDTIRARQQVSSRRKTSSIDSSINQTSLLFSNLYAGLVPALVGGIPAGAVFFGVKDYVKATLKSSDFVTFLGLSSPLSREEITILSVTAANLIYWLVRSPAEEIKTKRQVGQKTDELGLESLSKIKDVYQTVGVRGVVSLLYGSYLSNFAYALPADIAKFAAYEYLSAALFHAEVGVKMTGIDAAVAGALSGLVAQIITTPLDVSRTRIMTQEGQKNIDPATIMTTITTASTTQLSGAPLSKNPLVVLLDIIRTEGPGQLWSGLLPRAARAIGSGAIQFTSYELSQNFMQSG